jgi:hypothetical protein
MVATQNLDLALSLLSVTNEHWNEACEITSVYPEVSGLSR